MLEFVEWDGWRIQNHDEVAVEQFCAEACVKRHVLKEREFIDVNSQAQLYWRCPFVCLLVFLVILVIVIGDRKLFRLTTNWKVSESYTSSRQGSSI
ncbi:hypothetical protein K1719_044231 [Acacia pycnantha]|nr:hypothetical protein K1719_044227 [Acacia pycnantha]KAI9073829.1 hypothetical protein K1719_044231 [Acacia pycnantha]